MVYGSGGVMINGKLLADDFHITVTKKVEFLDNATPEMKEEAKNAEYEFALCIADSSPEEGMIGSGKYDKISPLREVSVSCMRQSGEQVDVETSIQLQYYSVNLICRFKLKSEDSVSFEITRKDGDPLGERELTFTLTECNLGGALYSQITTFSDEVDPKSEEEVHNLEYTCCNVFGTKEYAELDVDKTTVELGEKDFWTFDILMSTCTASGIVKEDEEIIYFIEDANEKSMQTLGNNKMMTKTSLTDNLDVYVYRFEVTMPDSSIYGFYEDDLKVYVRFTADQPIDGEYSKDFYGIPCTSSWTNGVMTREVDYRNYGNSGKGYANIYIAVPEGINFSGEIVTNMPEKYLFLYDKYPGDGPERAGYIEVRGIRRLYDSKASNGFGKIVVKYDSNYNRFLNFNMQITDENGVELANPKKAVGTLCVYIGNTQEFLVPKGSRFTISPNAPSRNIRLAINGTYPIELWENGEPSHLTGYNGDTYFTDGKSELTIVDGRATIQLKRDQTIKFLNLEPGLDYTVTEREANAPGTITEETNTSGTLTAGTVSLAQFVNKAAPGGPRLPLTGGPGIISFVVMGSSLIVIAALIVRRRRKRT